MMRHRIMVAVALCLALGACEKAKEWAADKPGAGGEQKDKADKAGAPGGATLADRLADKKWVGLVSDEPVELEIRREGDRLVGDLMFTYFGKPGVKETLEITVSGDKVLLEGKDYKRIAGAGSFSLEKMEGTLSEDGATLSGVNRPEGQNESQFSLSTGKTLAEIDPPLDLAAAEKTLIAGKWEGKAGGRPAKMKFSRKGDALTAVVQHGGFKTKTTVEILATGTLLMKAPDRPTQQGLESVSYTAQLGRDLSYLYGEYHVTLKQGFIEQGSSDQFALRNLAAAAPTTDAAAAPAAKKGRKSKE